MGSWSSTQVIVGASLTLTVVLQTREDLMERGEVEIWVERSDPSGIPTMEAEMKIKGHPESLAFLSALKDCLAQMDKHHESVDSGLQSGG